jgi:hypothetical protein
MIIRQVLRISQFGSNRTPSVHSTGLIFILKILCQTFIAFDQNKIIYDKQKKSMYALIIY